jgi:hypothetical protein
MKPRGLSPNAPSLLRAVPRVSSTIWPIERKRGLKVAGKVKALRK